MSLHHRHAHGHVLRGAEARQFLEIRKRDSHGSDIRLHVPEGFEEKAAVQTAVSVVFVTMPQTFSGDAVYVTMTGDPDSSTAAAAATSSADHAEASSSASKSSAQAHVSSTQVSTSLATVSLQSSSASPMTTFATASATLAGAGLSSSGQATVLAGSPVQATRSASASSTAGAISETSNGMSGGARAGLAIGIILAIALAAGLIFFCWRRKKNQTHEEITDEKHASFVDAGARRFEASGGLRDSTQTEKVPASLRSTRTASTAPRLSLRPVTQFLPNLGEKRKSSANALDSAAAAGGLAVSEKPRSAWERQPSQASQNPFEDAPAMSEKQSNPFDDAEGKKSSESLPATAAAAANAKHSPKSSWEGTEPPTPKSTKFGTAAAVPVAAAGAAKDVSPPRGPNNVHRVQLDFKPSMDDELELRSGQLVRMLHEYDDGWALCIRMDRSQQGVTPRTCLSKMPVKPRPQGPPGSRPGPPPQGARRPSNASPPHAPNMNGPMFPRPLTPQSSSPTSSNGDAPAQAAVPARKPVPGQAM